MRFGSSSNSFLRRVLLADAASCAGCGVLQLAASGPVSQVTALPNGLIVGTGVFLVLYAALVIATSLLRTLPPLPVRLFALGNIGWAAACVALIAATGANLSAAGIAYVLMQAVTVSVLAWLQLRALRALRALRDGVTAPVAA